jgi:hypothetical protein
MAGGPPRRALARFYVHALLPDHASLLARVREGSAPVLALTPDDLAA